MGGLFEFIKPLRSMLRRERRSSATMLHEQMGEMAKAAFPAKQMPSPRLGGAVARRHAFAARSSLLSLSLQAALHAAPEPEPSRR